MSPSEETHVPNQGIEEFTIESGASVSSALDVAEAVVAAIYMPATFAGDELAIQAAEVESGTYQDVYDDGGTQAVVTAAAGRVISLKDLANVFAPLRHVRFVSQTSGAAENQTADRVFQLLLKK